MKHCRITLAILIAFGCAMLNTGASGSTSAGKQADPPIVAKCKADLAKRLKLQAQDIKAVEVQQVIWPDAALGMPETGKMYAQVLTPGLRVTLQAHNSQYLYVTSTKAFRYGGLVSAWSYSMLYLQPVQNDANLNSDLYQCSLLGTNSTRLASAVADFYPQDRGAVIFKRRTSRSGHDLLHVQSVGLNKETMLYQAMDFGDAALNAAQDRWAAYVRPRLGVEWTVVVNRMGQPASEARTLSMPDGTQPYKIAWSGETLMILVKKDDRKVAFETTPKAGTPEWKPTLAVSFPGHDKFVLNKSETLEIGEVKEGGKPGVEVARVWFTGDRNVVARISDFTMRGCDLLGPYAFIWGEKGSQPAVYSVNISTGDTVVGLPGSDRGVKPFAYAPRRSPMTMFSGSGGAIP